MLTTVTFAPGVPATVPPTMALSLAVSTSIARLSPPRLTRTAAAVVAGPGAPPREPDPSEEDEEDVDDDVEDVKDAQGGGGGTCAAVAERGREKSVAC